MKVFLIILLVLLILLFFVYSIFPFFVINIMGLLNSTKNKVPLDIVIAHYNEDLKWVDNLPDNCRIFIYTKSDVKPTCNRKYFHEYLPNIGRDMNTFLYHIIKNYDKPHHDNILFLPGSSELFYKKINLNLLLHNIGKYNFNNCFLTNNFIIKHITYAMLDYSIKNGYCSSYKLNRHKDCSLIISQFKNVNQFKDHFDLKLYYISFFGMNMIKSKLIYNRSKNFYIKMYDIINSGENMLNIHFIERSWYSIFTGK